MQSWARKWLWGRCFTTFYQFRGRAVDWPFEGSKIGADPDGNGCRMAARQERMRVGPELKLATKRKVDLQIGQ